MLFIIGSGPAGVACAHALLARGYAVTLLDVGLEKSDVVENHFSLNIDPHDPIKLSHGSDYPYAEVANHFSIEMDAHINCIPSFARGGLSNVWGAFVENYQSKNFLKWPALAKSIENYYPTIFSMLNIANAKASQSSNNFFNLSQQATKILAEFCKNEIVLKNLGFTFATSTLAVQFKNKNALDCSYCGKCQRGCPQDLIYSAKFTLHELQKNSKLCYIKNVVVTNIKEEESFIEITATNRNKDKTFSYVASQVFLACGPIISTQIILNSTKRFNAPIQFSDSTHFMLPMFMYRSAGQVEKESLITLCQLFLKLHHPDISHHAINLQLYTYMDFYTEIIKTKFGIFSKAVLFLLTPLLNRLVVIQGHLHSDDSHKFELTLKEDNIIQLTSKFNINVNDTLKKLQKHLRKTSKLLKLLPLNFLLKISKIGKSFHYGCSIPMSDNPRINESDIWGKPFGFKKLHVVDASVLPLIPAGSITTTIMANAYRIGSECEIYE